MKQTQLYVVLVPLLFLSIVWTASAALPSQIETIGSTGTGDGQFDAPHDILIVEDRIYVSEVLNNRIQIFDLNWNYVDQFGGLGSGDGELSSPYGLETNGTHIFVADFGNDRVQWFDLDGEYAGQFGVEGTGVGELDGPIDIALDNGNIFVSDYWNDRIQVFNLTTHDALYFIDGSTGYSVMLAPSSIDIHNEILYVVDLANDTVKLYRKDLDQFIDYIESPSEASSPWAVNVIGDRIYVSHTSDVIEVYDLSRNYLEEIRSDLDSPRNIVVKDKSFYVAEYSDDEISHFRLVASPSEVTVTPGEISITISWSINTEEGISEPEYYRIYRDNGNSTTYIGETIDRIFVDFPPDLFTEYEYQIQAVSSVGESDLTSSVAISVHEPEITEADEDDGSFFDSVPISIAPIMAVLLLIPILRKYQR